MPQRQRRGSASSRRGYKATNGSYSGGAASPPTTKGACITRHRFRCTGRAGMCRGLKVYFPTTITKLLNCSESTFFVLRVFLLFLQSSQSPLSVKVPFPQKTSRRFEPGLSATGGDPAHGRVRAPERVRARKNSWTPRLGPWLGPEQLGGHPRRRGVHPPNPIALASGKGEIVWQRPSDRASLHCTSL